MGVLTVNFRTRTAGGPYRAHLYGCTQKNRRMLSENSRKILRQEVTEAGQLLIYGPRQHSAKSVELA
jgi:hypothetical protein